MAAAKIVKTMSKTNDNWYAQNSRYIAECDYNTSIHVAHDEGVAEGVAKGARQQAIETAKKMIIKNYAINDISELTGLSVKEIQEL